MHQKTLKILNTLIKMNYNVKIMENYSSDQAHKLARLSHTIYENWTETTVSIKNKNMYFDLLCES